MPAHSGAVDRVASRPLMVECRRDFPDAFLARFLTVETVVASVRDEYGGTADAFIEIDGAVWPHDHKTREGVYPDASLQPAGLDRAHFTRQPGGPTQYPVPAGDTNVFGDMRLIGELHRPNLALLPIGGH